MNQQTSRAKCTPNECHRATGQASRRQCSRVRVLQRVHVVIAQELDWFDESGVNRQMTSQATGNDTRTTCVGVTKYTMFVGSYGRQQMHCRRGNYSNYPKTNHSGFRLTYTKDRMEACVRFQSLRQGRALAMSKPVCIHLATSYTATRRSRHSPISYRREYGYCYL